MDLRTAQDDECFCYMAVQWAYCRSNDSQIRMDQDKGLRQDIRSCNTLKETDADFMMLPEPSQNKEGIYEQRHKKRYKSEECS